MSKRNRNKFRSRDYNHRAVSATATGNSSASVAASTPARAASGLSGAQAQHAAEYKIIRSDMIRLVVLNGIMLIAVLALYYVNKSSGIVEKLYSQLF